MKYFSPLTYPLSLSYVLLPVTGKCIYGHTSRPLAMTVSLFNPEGVHGGDGGGAVGGNDGGEKGANPKRSGRDSQREGVPRGDAVELGGEQAPGANGQRQAEDQS